MRLKHRRRARRILRSLELLYDVGALRSDEPTIDAYNEAKASGQLGDMTFREFTGSIRPSWRDRRLEARLARS